MGGTCQAPHFLVAVAISVLSMLEERDLEVPVRYRFNHSLYDVESLRIIPNEPANNLQMPFRGRAYYGPRRKVLLQIHTKPFHYVQVAISGRTFNCSSRTPLRTIFV